MKDYQRILVATDFADASRVAARRGAELAHHYGASLILLHVIEHFPEDIPVNPVVPEDVDPARFYLERARQNLAELAETIGHKKAAQRVVVSTGSARYEILRFAEAERIDLIVVGSRGSGPLEALGSTAMGVIYDARCDAMVIRVAG
jgi:nucleotide-binding universal stress UspA family protein